MAIELSEHFEMVTKDNPDGSMDVSIAYDEIFKNEMKRIYNRKRCTKKLVREFFEGAFDFIDKMYNKWDKEENE